MKNTIDLKEHQNNAFEASVENVKQANEAVKSAQNWMLVLGLAELTFLSTLMFQYKEGVCVLVFVKVLVILLFIAFITFLFGSLTQYRHLLGVARKFENVSINTCVYMKNNVESINVLPSELEFPTYSQIKSSSITNILFATSFFCVVVVTMAIAGLIFFI